VIRTTGAQLVSVTENIDEITTGLLLHDVMASIAEFSRRNLAAEGIKGREPYLIPPIRSRSSRRSGPWRRCDTGASQKRVIGTQHYRR
jgi:hypothetical protein